MSRTKRGVDAPDKPRLLESVRDLGDPLGRWAGSIRMKMIGKTNAPQETSIEVMKARKGAHM